MKKILLVNPDVDFDVATFEALLKIPALQKKAFMVPLPLATIAALTPDDIEVDIWDEPVHGRIDDSTEFKRDYDLVGLTGYVVHLRRTKKIAQVFRKRGIPVAIGGPGVSASPEICRDFFDILFIGEAEFIWPQFIDDWRTGSYRNEYRQVAKPSLETTPLPHWCNLVDDFKYYALGAVQTTRGCPFDCEFCDVIYLFGRLPRHKPIDKVLEEVAMQARLGLDRVFFTDDNFIGNPRYAKELLKALIPHNNSFERPLQFQTQITINMAKDEELLELLADANFSVLFIGVETPNKEALKETNKIQNYNSNLVEDLRKIMSYGMAIRAGMIVGFDHDTPEIFDQQFEFIQETCIPVPAMNLLEAPVGTKLWARMHREGRLLAEDSDNAGNFSAGATNIIPKGMTRVELFSGYYSLVEKLSNWSHFEERMKGFISGIKRRPNVPQKSRTSETLVSPRQAFSGLSPEARRAISNIFLHTLEHAPFMLEKMAGFIFMQISEVAMMEAIQRGLPRQIELEKSGTIKLEINRSDILVPESFKEGYKKVFPEIYQRIHEGLLDKDRVEVVIVEVFADFLTRWGKTFERFEEHHRVFLVEIADRTIEKENGVAKERSSPSTSPDYPDIKRLGRLSNEVLKHVEQELRVSH